MTAAEFYEALAETKNGWELCDGQIRHNKHCPITMVASHLGAKNVTNAVYWGEAAKFLGLARTVAGNILRASDFVGGSPKTRKRLLDCVGLKEVRDET